MLYAFGDYTFDSARFELYRRELPLSAEPQVLRLLQYLIENRDRVVLRRELHRKLWGARFVTDNALTVLVRQARMLLGDDGSAQAVIKTIHGAGYRFRAPVDCMASSTVARVQPEPDRAPKQTGVRNHRCAEQVADRPWTGQPSIAVLRFESISGDESETIFARGLAHDIITRIARSRTMLIIARGSAFRFSADEQDVVEIGRLLGVRYLVQGAVQIAARRLRIFVALANVLTGEEIWSDQFTRRLDDFMLIQEEITDAIVNRVEASVQQEEMQRSLLAPSSNLDAWSLFHRGLHHLYRFKRRDCDKAERLFRRSIDLEPGVPRPYAGLSFVHFERVFMHFEDRRAEGIAKAFDYAEQSLSIDPLDPMGHWVLARAHLLRAELDASKNSLDTAISLNPSYANARYSLGWVAMHLGENELCKDSIDAAVRLSPYDPFMYAMQGVLALNLALMGQAEAATALAQQSMRQPNAHYQVGAFAAVTHALSGDMETARKLYVGVRRVVPAYSADQFLSVFPFQRRADVRRVRKAFGDMQVSHRTG